MSLTSATGLSDSADTDVRLPKLYWAGYEFGSGGFLIDEGGPSVGASPPKRPREWLPPPELLEREKDGVEGDAPVSVSSSSIMLSMSGGAGDRDPDLVSVILLSPPNGFELAAKGLVKVAPDILRGSGVCPFFAFFDRWCVRSSARRRMK